MKADLLEADDLFHWIFFWCPSRYPSLRLALSLTWEPFFLSFFSFFLSFFFLSFLDASTHLYKRLCPSVRWLVGWLVGPWWSSWEWWKCIKSWKYLRLLHHSIDPWLVYTPRTTLHHSTWSMQYCIILNKLTRMWTHRCTPGVLVFLRPWIMASF